MAATLTAAHHGFELSSGVGLVLQPELGLGPASALWGTGIPVWIILAARGDRRWDKLLAVWSGAALGGVLVHFLLWPSSLNRLGIPVLTDAEGLSPSGLPPYNVLLHVWGVASALSIVRDLRPGTRRWALVGLAMLPLLRRSAQHHFFVVGGTGPHEPGLVEQRGHLSPGCGGGAGSNAVSASHIAGCTLVIGSLRAPASPLTVTRSRVPMGPNARWWARPACQSEMCGTQR